MKTFLFLAAIAVLAGSVLAADPPEEAANPVIVSADTSVSADTAEAIAENSGPSDPAETPPASADKNKEPAELSTELDGLDTLDVVPTEVITQVGGGTRRVGLENTVFRREAPVIYETDGRRDPFRALITDEKKEGEVETEFLRLEGAALKGVVWSDGQYLALISDKDGKSFVLREGDPVYQGRVVSVMQSQAVFEVSDFGDYQQITLKVKG
jgi:hypothetical protein